jgi:hypothetical protein
MRVKLKELKEEMRQRRHHSIPEQGNWLKQVVTGFFAQTQRGLSASALLNPSRLSFSNDAREDQAKRRG